MPISLSIKNLVQGSSTNLPPGCDADTDPAAARCPVSPRRHGGHGDFTEASGFSVHLPVLCGREKRFKICRFCGCKLLKTLGAFCKFLFFITTCVSVVNKVLEFFLSLVPTACRAIIRNRNLQRLESSGIL